MSTRGWCDSAGRGVWPRSFGIFPVGSALIASRGALSKLRFTDARVYTLRTRNKWPFEWGMNIRANLPDYRGFLFEENAIVLVSFQGVEGVEYIPQPHSIIK